MGICVCVGEGERENMSVGFMCCHFVCLTKTWRDSDGVLMYS